MNALLLVVQAADEELAEGRVQAQAEQQVTRPRSLPTLAPSQKPHLPPLKNHPTLAAETPPWGCDGVPQAHGLFGVAAQGRALVEVLTYLTVSPLLCGDVETCGLGAEMQLLMSGQRRHLRGSGRPAPPLGA